MGGGNKMQNDFLSVKGTARRLDKSENTIRTWERQGKLRAIKTENGRRVFERDEVERLVEQLRREGRQ